MLKSSGDSFVLRGNLLIPFSGGRDLSRSAGFTQANTVWQDLGRASVLCFYCTFSPQCLRRTTRQNFRAQVGKRLWIWGFRLGKVNKPYISSFLKEQLRTFLVVLWLRIWLPMQEEQGSIPGPGRSLGTTKPMPQLLKSTCPREATAMRSPWAASRE